MEISNKNIIGANVNLPRYLNLKFVWVIFLLILLSLSSCNDDPPVVPQPPISVGFQVTGDINLNLEFRKVQSQFLDTSITTKDNFSISGGTESGGKSYDINLTVVITDTNNKIYPAVFKKDTNNTKNNYSIVAFIYRPDGNTKIVYIADSGFVQIEEMYNRYKEYRLKGKINIKAVGQYDTTKIIRIKDGWFDYQRSF